MSTDDSLHRELLNYQRNEITEHHIYRKIAATLEPSGNRDTLERIAQDELAHYHVWRSHTGRDVGPSLLKVWFYYLVSRVLGFTFGIKLMERGEDAAQDAYSRIAGQVPEAAKINQDETDHEEALIRLLQEERLQYTGSMVLGLNDALVELTGALAGLTFALQDTRLIALTGSITGIAAAMSMAASEYLSTKAEETSRNPGRASVYTGIAYIVTVVVLITPYLVPELLPEPGRHAHPGRADHRILHLLPLGGQGRAVQGALPGNGRHIAGGGIRELPGGPAPEGGLRGGGLRPRPVQPSRGRIMSRGIVPSKKPARRKSTRAPR